MFKEWTERAKRVLALAQEEARRFRHGQLRIGDLLLGLIKEGEGMGFEVLKQLDLYLEKVVSDLEKRIQKGKRKDLHGNALYSPEVKAVLEKVNEVAEEMKHNYIGTEHLLLAMIKVGGKDVQVLRDLGIDYEKVKTKLLELLGGTLVEESSKEKEGELPKMRTGTFSFYFPSGELKKVEYDRDKIEIVISIGKELIEKTIIVGGE